MIRYVEYGNMIMVISLNDYVIKYEMQRKKKRKKKRKRERKREREREREREKEKEREKEREREGVRVTDTHPPTHLAGFHGFQVDHVRTVRALPVTHHTARMYEHRSCVDAKKDEDKTGKKRKVTNNVNKGMYQ